MANVEIYYWTTCPHCRAALALLDQKGVEYTGYDITGDQDAKDKMADRTGGPSSVPQIFINGKLVEGGNSGLQELEQKGELDALLNG